MSTPQAEIKLTTPFEVEISKELKGRYGYKDAHAEVDIKVPSPFSIVKKELTLKIDPEDAERLLEALKKWKMWKDLPDFQRERDGA